MAFLGPHHNLETMYTMPGIGSCTFYEKQAVLVYVDGRVKVVPRGTHFRDELLGCEALCYPYSCVGLISLKNLIHGTQ